MFVCGQDGTYEIKTKQKTCRVAAQLKSFSSLQCHTFTPQSLCVWRQFKDLSLLWAAQCSVCTGDADRRLGRSSPSSTSAPAGESRRCGGSQPSRSGSTSRSSGTRPVGRHSSSTESQMEHSLRFASICNILPEFLTTLTFYHLETIDNL